MLQTLEAKINESVEQNAPENVHPGEWDLGEILNELEPIYPIKQRVSLEDMQHKDRDEIRRILGDTLTAAYERKEAEVSPQLMRMIEQRYLLLPIIDRQWVDHLYVMDHLKNGIGLRGYGQKDPRVEYEKEAYEIFEDLKNNIADEAIKSIFRVQLQEGPPPDLTPEQVAAFQAQDGIPGFAPIPAGSLQPVPQLLGQPPAPIRRPPQQLRTNKDDDSPAQPLHRDQPKVGRNDMCPCGSGKKYKKCHGTAA
jgi:preprotein translocase subunit SecA